MNLREIEHLFAISVNDASYWFLWIRVIGERNKKDTHGTMFCGNNCLFTRITIDEWFAI
jgi:hypothetical protein